MNDALRRLVRHIRADRSVQITLVIAVIVNAVLLGAWAWSRGGQTTHVRIETHGKLIAVYVDGRLTVGAQLAAQPTGSLVLTLPDTKAIPSLPSPRGIDRITVRDIDTGATLFDDDFSNFPGRNWRVVDGHPYGDGGVVGSEGPATIALNTRAWGDVSVDVTYRNVTTASVTVRAQPDLTGMVTTVRPFHWNEDFSKWASVALGPPGTAGPGARLELSRAESVKAMLATALHAYPYLGLLLIVAVLAVLLVQYIASGVTIAESLPSPPLLAWRYVIAAVAIAAFGVILYFNVTNAAHMPYVPDSITYIFQAKMLASGHITAPPPPVENAFNFFEAAPPIIVRNGRWIGQYPLGHPVMLAIGLRLHAIWLIPSLLAGASVALIGITGRAAYNTRTGILAAALLATSPFFIMNATNFMSHNTAAFYLLACLGLIAVIDRRPLLYAAGAGLFFGLLMNTRPLSAAALVVPIGVFLLWRLLRDRAGRRTGMLQIAAFVSAAAAMLAVYMLYNYATTGDPLRSGYQASGVSFFGGGITGGGTTGSGLGGAIGAGSGGHDYSLGIQNERIQMTLLLLVINGWPQFVGLAFILLPFVLGARRAWDWFLLACALSVMSIWTFYESAGVMYGPRYWYEALPFLILLSARGADRAADVVAGWASWLRTRDIGAVATRGAASAVVFGFAGVLVLSSMWGWLLGERTTWRADFVPNRAGAMCCVLGMDDRIVQMVDEQRLHNVLVLVEPCQSFICYGSVFWRNNTTLDGDIVYARDVPGLRDELRAAYPDRAIYLASYNARTLRALDATTPTRPPAPTPSPAAGAPP